MILGLHSLFIKIVALNQKHFQLTRAKSENDTVHRNVRIDRSDYFFHATKVGNKIMKTKVNVKNTLTNFLLEVKW